VIPAGGAGTRLWPRSRRSTPKHVLALGDSGRPLLRETFDRAAKLASEVFVLTEAGQRDIIALAGELALKIHQLLGHDKQRDAARAGHQFAVFIRDLGQHDVHDVLGQLVIA